MLSSPPDASAKLSFLGGMRRALTGGSRQKHNVIAAAPGSEAPPARDIVFGFHPDQAEPVEGDESIMSAKVHGTSATPVQPRLRWGCDTETADRICNFNRHFAEHSGYFLSKGLISDLAQAERKGFGPVDFFDSNTGEPLFRAPLSRSFEQFLNESKKHGWPSFRDAEVNWDKVRVLPNGECVSIDGTHLGHNLPDRCDRSAFRSWATCPHPLSLKGQSRPGCMMMIYEKSSEER